ncbi:MAG: hypothetical protein GY850_47050, partial [bacterium]|nr:hypothetical protein [bacterium]
MENPFKRKCCLYTVIIQLSVAVLSGTALPVYAAASLHDLNGYVFYDHNHNGLKDAGDEGLTGVTVVLEKVKFSRLKPALIAVEEAITNRRGYYRFTKVEPFCLYKVQERSPQCCEMTTLDTAYIFITERSAKKEILFGHGNPHQPGLSAAEVPSPTAGEDDTECLPDSECTANVQQGPAAPDIDLYDAVLEAVTGSCSQESLERLETFEPAAVRESLLEIDRDYKLLQWQSGLSRG